MGDLKMLGAICDVMPPYNNFKADTPDDLPDDPDDIPDTTVDDKMVTTPGITADGDYIDSDDDEAPAQPAVAEGEESSSSSDSIPTTEPLPSHLASSAPNSESSSPKQNKKGKNAQTLKKKVMKAASVVKESATEAKGRAALAISSAADKLTQSGGGDASIHPTTELPPTPDLGGADSDNEEEA